MNRMFIYNYLYRVYKKDLFKLAAICCISLTLGMFHYIELMFRTRDPRIAQSVNVKQLYNKLTQIPTNNAFDLISDS